MDLDDELHDIGERVSETIRDARRRLNGKRIWGIQIFNQPEKPNPSTEEIEIAKHAEESIGASIEAQKRVAAEAEAGKALSAAKKEIEVERQARVDDAFAVLEDHYKHIVVTMVDSRDCTLVYWHWKYAYTLVAERGPESDGPAEKAWEADETGRWIEPPENAAATYGYLVIDSAENTRFNTTEAEPRHAPYELLLRGAGDDLHYALTLSHDMVRGFRWLERGIPPDEAIECGVHPDRRWIDRIGCTNGERWIKLKGDDGLFIESESDELVAGLNPWEGWTAIGDVTIHELAEDPNRDDERREESVIPEGTRMLVQITDEDGSPGPRTLRTVEKAFPLTELPNRILDQPVTELSQYGLLVLEEASARF